LAILKERGYIPYHPLLAKRFNHRVALFLGACLYWTRRNMLRNSAFNGWIYLTAREMTEATALSRREQETVRALLRQDGILQERKGANAVLHYRINLRALVDAIETFTYPPDEQISVLDVWSMFRGAVAFYRPMADITGSCSGGIYLSWLMQRQKQMLLTRQAVQVPHQAVSAALYLSDKVLRTTRQRLCRQGIITENGLWTQPNLPAIIACLEQQQQRARPRPSLAQPEPGRAVQSIQSSQLVRPRPDTPGKVNRNLILQPELPWNATSREPTVRSVPQMMSTCGWLVAGFTQLNQTPSAGNPERKSRLLLARGGAQNAKPVDNFEGTIAQNAKPAAQSAKPIAQSAKPNLPKTPCHINNNTNITNTTTTVRVREGAVAVDKSGSQAAACRRRVFEDQKSNTNSPNELIFPDGLTPEVLPGIRDVLSHAPAEHRQALLDELQGQMRLPGKTIHNPAGWLVALIRRMNQGAALPLAESVASLRRQQQAVQRQIDGALDKPTSAGAATQPAFDPDAASKRRKWLLAERQRRGI
jgi:hypothetical protein